MAVFIDVGDIWIGEGDVSARFTVRLSERPVQPVTVSWRTAADGASQGFDFGGASGTLTFAPNEDEKTVVVSLVENGGVEAPEAFHLELFSAVGATLLRSRATAVILDNDSVAASPHIWVEDVLAEEGDADAAVIVRLSAASTSIVTVDFATAPGSAVAGSDYRTTSGTLTFLPGEVVKTVPIAIVDGGARETLESFSVALSNPSAGQLGQSRATVFVRDDDAREVPNPFIDAADIVVSESDALARFEVTLSAPSNSPVTVNWRTVADSASQGFDYRGASGALTFLPGEVSREVLIPLVEDARFEASSAFHLELLSAVGGTPLRSRATAEIVDNDTLSASPGLSVGDSTVEEDDGLVSLAVRLDAASTSPVTVSYETRDGGATAGADYEAVSGQLTFLPGEVAKTVRVRLLEDRAAEGPEDFFLRLKNASGATLGDAAGRVTIVDDDARAAVAPVVNVADAWIGEGDGFARFEVTLSAPTNQAVSLSWRTSAVTASQGFDYRGATGALTFAPGEVTRTILVPLVDNVTAEVAETFQLQVFSSVGALLGRDRGTATVVDNDATPVASPIFGPFPDGPTTVAEDAGWFDLPVQLLAPSPAIQRVSYRTVAESADAGVDFLPASGALSFLPGEVVKTLRVFLLDDQDFDTGETFRIRFSGDDGSAPSGLSTSVRVRIIDDETPIVGGPRADRLKGGNFADQIQGEGGSDRLYGGRGDDKLYGGAGNDRLSGGGGSDRLIGGSGKDVLIGGAGSDRMSGSGGADSFVFLSERDSRPGRRSDVILDFTGKDEIDLSAIDANDGRPGNQRFDYIGRSGFSDDAGELRFRNGVLEADLDGDGRADFAVLLDDVTKLSVDDFVL